MGERGKRGEEEWERGGGKESGPQNSSKNPSGMVHKAFQYLATRGRRIPSTAGKSALSNQ